MGHLATPAPASGYRRTGAIKVRYYVHGDTHVNAITARFVRLRAASALLAILPPGLQLDSDIRTSAAWGEHVQQQVLYWYAHEHAGLHCPRSSSAHPTAPSP